MHLTKLLNKFKVGDERTLIAKKNVFYSFFIKGFGILTSLLIIPLTINYLNATEYGIWLTLNSILMWVNTFDIGLGNGLRNKLAESLAQGDYVKAKIYVSTSYCVIFLLMIIIFLLFQGLNMFLDWHRILNIDISLVPNLNAIVLMSFALFCLNFILKLIGNILLAMQKTAIENLLIMIGQVLSLIVIYALSFFSKGNLFKVALVYSISPVIVYAISYPFVFRNQYKAITPSVNYFRKEYVKSLIGLGSKFFVLQIAGLVIFSTANLLISNMFGPKMVTTYNVAARYFNIIPMLFSIVLTPIWSATTDAFVKQDYEWIKKSMNKVNGLLVIAFFVLAVMILCSNFVYEKWIGNLIVVPMELSVLMGIYVFILVASMSYSSFLNGIGKLRIQMLNILFCSILFLPLTYFLAGKFGIKGIVGSLILVNLSGLVLNYIQFNLLINKKGTGIWNK
jgi:O-antigen/teichoic acid export membrane protein